LDNNDYIMFQFANIRELYTSSYQRLVTMATLMNSGGILSIITLLSGDAKDKYNHIFSIACISFYPLKFALMSFSLALFLCFLILFMDFKFNTLEFQRISDELQRIGKYSLNPLSQKINRKQWIRGRISIFFMVLGAFFSLISVFNSN